MKNSDWKISVIIPVVDEAALIDACISQFTCHARAKFLEIIVVDGGSTDNTVQLARRPGVRVVVCHGRSRAKQMNFGASLASHDYLYFVHVDVHLPGTFYDDIVKSIQEHAPVGCYRARFGHNRGLIRLNSYLNRFSNLICRGGDQTMYITRTLFDQMGGFDENYSIMEDFDFIRRLMRADIPFWVIPRDVVVSTRKYDRNTWLRVQYANAIAMLMFTINVSPDTIKAIYGKLLNYRPANYN